MAVKNSESSKFSMDLLNENKEALVEKSKHLKKKPGPLVNFLVKKIFRMPKRMREAFLAFCLSKCNEINAKMADAGAYEKTELENEKQWYIEMAQIFGLPLEQTDPTLRKYMMVDGILVAPREWIVLNPEDEGKCRYAGVIECRNSEKYGIPHFLFYTNTKYACNYDDDFTETVYSWAKEKWPRFEEIMKQEVKLVSDPENPGQYLNAMEHLASPVIGLFHILRNDDEHFQENPPYGAMIIAKAKNEKK